MTDREQQALAEALVRLFGNGLEIKLQPHEFGFFWNGESFGSLVWKHGDWDEGMGLNNIVSAALNTAHDTMLEGMGYAGTHLGPLATSSADYVSQPDGFLLRVMSADGTLLRSVLFSVQ